MKAQKKQRLLLIINEIKKGKNPAKISKEHKINKKTLQNYLRQLKEKGCIEKVGYGTWKFLKEVSISSKATSLQKQIRGHAFNWKIKFKKRINWVKRLEKNNIKYQLIGVNSTTPRIIFNNKKIWFTKGGLVIYEPQSFFARSGHTAKGKAVWELDKTIKSLGRRLKMDLNTYWITTSREHYAMMKNELAKQYNDDGEKLFIRDDGGIWLWVDFSHGHNELETNNPIISNNVQKWYNNHKKHKFIVDSDFILNGFNKQNQMIGDVTKNQMMFNQNFVSHVSVIRKLGDEVQRLGKVISSLKNDNKDLNNK